MLIAMLPTLPTVSAAEATPFSVDFRTVDTTTLGGTNNLFLTATTKGENWSVNTNETTLRMGADIKLNVQFSPFADSQTWSTTGKATFNFTVPADGKYNVDLYGMRRPEGGVGNFYIDGNLVGTEEFYAATAEYQNPIKKELESVEITAGTHKLTIEVAGKNQGSYNLLLVQRLDFTPISDDEKPTEFVLDFSKVDTSTLNGQYAKPNTTVKGPNWSLDTTVSGGSTAFGNSSPVRFYLNSYMQLGLYANQVNAQQDTLIINFDVPVSGKYDISGYFRRNTAGGYGDIYIDDAKQITYDFYASAVENKTKKITTRASQSETYAYACVYNFTFTPAEEAPAPKLASAELSYEKRYILLSDSEGKKLTLSAKYDDGLDVDVWNTCEVSFKSSDTSVATVSSDGTVKPVKAGNITITATVTLDDVTKDATINLIISEEPVLASYVYDFTTPSTSDIFAITFESDGWRINKSKSDSWVVNTKNIVRFQSYGIQAQIYGVDARNDLALDINVGVGGIYDMTFVYDRYASGGGIAYLYVDGVYVGEIDTYSVESVSGAEKKLRPIKLSAGAHTVQIKAIGRPDGSSAANVYAKRIELPSLSSVKVSAKESLFVGENDTAKVTYVFANGAEVEARNNFDGKANPGDSFSVASDSASASVSGNTITAVSEGNASITATATVGEATKTSEPVTITVIKPVLESVTLSAPKYILLSDADGETFSVSALYNSGKPVDIATDAELTFESSDKSVATVSGTGVVTPVTAGDVTITLNITIDSVTLSDEAKIIISETPVYENIIVDFKNQTADTAYNATIETNGWQLNKNPPA